MVDAPYWIFPFAPPDPSNAYYAHQISENYEPEMKGRILNEFLGAYFTYPAVDTPDFDPKSFVIMNHRGNMDIPNTMDRMDEEGLYGPNTVELDGSDGMWNNSRLCGFTPAASVHETAILRGVPLKAFDTTARNVLFSGELSKNGWEGKIASMWGENSMWIVAYGGWMLERELREQRVRGEGVGTTSIRTKSIPLANHFVS
jgi:hypothetical protein